MQKFNCTQDDIKNCREIKSNNKIVVVVQVISGDDFCSKVYFQKKKKKKKKKKNHYLQTICYLSLKSYSANLDLILLIKHFHMSIK